MVYHLTTTCSKDGSLHSTHSAVLATIAQAGRHFWYRLELEGSDYLQGSESDSHKRPDSRATSWPEGEVITDLAGCSPVSTRLSSLSLQLAILTDYLENDLNKNF